MLTRTPGATPPTMGRVDEDAQEDAAEEGDADGGTQEEAAEDGRC